MQSLSIKTTVLLLFCIAINTASSFAQSRLDSLLNILDKTIELENQFDAIKTQNINKLNKQLNNKHLQKEEAYTIYRNLSKEYDAYLYDSAKIYSEKSAAIASALKVEKWINESKIQLALLHARAGMFSNAIETLGSIDKNTLTTEQLFSYFKTYSDTYTYWIEYLEGVDNSVLIKNRSAYQDSLLQIVPPNSCEYVINFGTKFIEQNKLNQAEKLLLSYLPKIEIDTREYSVTTAIIAYMYEVKKQNELQEEYLALSATSDIKASIKENNSLRLLAILLYENGDLDRANRYIKKCVEDANFYHARLRNIQTSKVLPIIDKAYQKDRERQEDKLKLLLAIVSLLSFVLMIAIYLVFRQKKKVSKAKEIIQLNNITLNQLNNNLQSAMLEQEQTSFYLEEANLVKEQYISNFMEITAEYIDKFDSFKTMVNRKIATGQTKDILRFTAESEESNKDLKKFYESFDKAFLNIYPNFTREINKLLRTEEQYPISENTLNQELRIFALIRLGITDSNKMASFLHYSLRTIYNYRSKVKAKAINQQSNFEEQVKHICKIQLQKNLSL